MSMGMVTHMVRITVPFVLAIWGRHRPCRLKKQQCDEKSDQELHHAPIIVEVPA